MHLDSETLQLLSHKTRGHLLFIGYLRKLMEMLAPGRHFSLFVFKLSNQSHLRYPVVASG